MGLKAFPIVFAETPNVLQELYYKKLLQLGGLSTRGRCNHEDEFAVDL